MSGLCILKYRVLKYFKYKKMFYFLFLAKEDVNISKILQHIYLSAYKKTNKFL